MKSKPSALVTPFLVLSVGLLGQTSALALAIAYSQVTFTEVVITPGAGTLVFSSSWQGSAFAQATVSAQFNMGSGGSDADAAGDFSLAHGGATAAPPQSRSGQGSASVLIPGQTDASDSATGRGALWTIFTITGGSGAVNTHFSAKASGSLNGQTDAYGELAEAETIFTLELDGTPLLFDDRLFSLGPNEFSSQVFSTVLTNSLTLQFNTPYFLRLDADAEAHAINTTPDGGSSLGALAVGTLIVAWLKRASFRRRGKTRRGGGGMGMIGLLVLAAQLWLAGDCRALFIGSDPPDVCLLCGSPPNRAWGGYAQMSLSEGNLRVGYPMVSVRSSGGATLPMALTYNSYNADNSRAQVDSGLGLGWTHSYNIFLFQQRSHMFRMDGDGRVTQYRLGAGGTYTADPGYFETFTSHPDGSFTITNKMQSWWHFTFVPNTPFLVGGPVYRLIQMGDRNQNLTTMSYSNGLLVLVTDTYGRSLAMTYTNQNKLATITDPLGRTTRFHYDAAGRLPMRITDADNRATRYSYNSSYQMNRSIDPDGRIFLYLFKNQRPYAVVDGLGQTLHSLANPGKWAYDAQFLGLMLMRKYTPATTTKTDGLNRQSLYQYDTNGYITRIVAPDSTITSYTYDPATRLLISMTNANGAVTRYQYDALGNRTNMIDALGNATRYAYDATFNLVTNITDPNGRVTTFQYDSSGNLTNQIDPLGQTLRYTYDSHGNVMTQTDKRGMVTQYTYDAFGNRVLMIEALALPEQRITSYTYDAVGNLTSLTDPLGRTSAYTYDALDRLSRQTNALGGVTRYQYDALGRSSQVTDANGNRTSFTYDTRARLAFTTNALGDVTSSAYDRNNNPTNSTDQLGRVTTYAYDALDRRIRTTNALGGITTTTYDVVGNQRTETDENGHTTSYRYDALNRRTAITNALGYVTQFDYATAGGPPCCSPTIGSGLITRQEDANGHVIFFKYDALDRQVQIIRKQGDTNDVIDANDAVTTYFYDPNGNRLAVTDPNTNTTTFGYDALNRLVTTTNAVGDVTRYQYDPVNNLVRTLSANGNVTTNAYDGLNRVTEVRDPIGLVTSNAYDAVGNRVVQTDGDLHPTRYTYDAMNRVTEMKDPLDGRTAYTYDAVGNLLTHTDPNTNAVTYTYDALNRRATTIDALSHTTTYAYDAVGNVLQVTDPNSHITSYTYDAVDQLTRETYPDAPPNSRNYTYDPVGNLVTRTNQQGRTTTYVYDDLYRLTARDYSVGVDDHYTYDLGGRALNSDRGGWITTFTYDGANRLLQTTQAGRAITYSYDIPGRTRRTVYPSGQVITNAMDERGRLLSVRDDSASPPLAVYVYDSADRLLGRIYRNNTVSTWAYDDNGRITMLDHTNLSGRIAGFIYDYDPAGNKRFEAKLHQPADSEAYQYDAIDRLVDFRVGTLDGTGHVPAPVISVQWNLDPVGNWSSFMSNAVLRTRAHNEANEITFANGGPVLYDNNGNLSQDGLYLYAYDEEDRLATVMRLSDSALVGQYFYDAFGRRVAKIVNPAGTSVTNYYFYDRLNLVEEEDGTGAAQAVYAYGSYVDDVLVMARAGQTYFYHDNALYSPAALTDGTGAVVERYAYDAYGGVTVLTPAYAVVPPTPWGVPMSSVGNPWLFTGRQLDSETGLYHYRHRHLHSSFGRFLERDPLGPDGSNLYQYVEGNPVNYLDPLGLYLLAVDGTGSRDWSTDAAFRASGGFKQSHVRNFYDDYRGGKAYWHGPDSAVWETLDGIESSAKHRGVYGWACRVHCANPNEPLDLVGHSRGGHIVLQVAHQLNTDGCCCNGTVRKPVPIRFLGLYDPVDMAGPYGGNYQIPANVGTTVALISHSQTRSRSGWTRSFAWGGNDANTWYWYIRATHAAIGGAPYTGDQPDTVTPQSEMRLSREADQWMREKAIAAGVPVQQRSDDYYSFDAAAIQRKYDLKQAIRRQDELRARSGARGICFVAGTLIQTDAGPVPIEQLNFTHRVLAANPETAMVTLLPLSRLLLNQTYTLVTVVAGTSTITSTPDHPYWVQGKGWVSAERLAPGDSLVNASGKLTPVRATTRRITAEPVSVYNVTVASQHTYLVGPDGFIVHNR